MAILTRAEYRRLSGDHTSYDGDVDVALAEVQEAVERFTDRKFDYGTYTERVISYGSKLFPMALPVDTVTIPENAKVFDFGVETSSYWGLDYARNEDLYGYSDYVEMTYSGGYKPEDMPIELKKLVAEITQQLVSSTSDADGGGTFSSLGDLPAGVTSVSVGPVSISGNNLTTGAASSGGNGGGASAYDVIQGSIEKRLLRWRRPEVMG